MAGRTDGFYWVRLGTRWRVAEYEKGTWYSTKWSQGGAEDAPDFWDEIGPRIAALAAIGSGTQGAKDEIYAERNRLVAALAHLYPSGIARTDIPGWEPEWHGCVYIDLPTGQASWHYHDREAHLFADLPPYQGQWDGHDTATKYERLALLRSGTQGRDADGWKEATIAWEVCASIHREYAKGKDALFTTRQGDFMHHAEEARSRSLASPKKITAPELAEVDEAIEKLRKSVEPSPPAPPQAERDEAHLQEIIKSGLAKRLAPPPAASDLRDLERARTILHYPRGYLTQHEAELLTQLAAEFAAIRAEAKAEGAQEEREKWMSCARVDALMEGPHLKGWSRSDLDRMWVASNRPSPTGQDQE